MLQPRSRIWGTNGTGRGQAKAYKSAALLREKEGAKKREGRQCRFVEIGSEIDLILVVQVLYIYAWLCPPQPYSVSPAGGHGQNSYSFPFSHVGLKTRGVGSEARSHSTSR